jgi:serine/threonine protein kinase
VLHPGESFGRYRLESEIGRGGMGIVYLALDEQVSRRIALKVIGTDIAENDEFRARFVREMRIAVKLEHPNVVPVYETGEIDGGLYIAMRYVEGFDLAQLIAEDGSLAPSRVARLALTLGSALDTAHAMGLVHRDVKPANVLLTGGGDYEHVYLTDFGLTREAGSDSRLTNTGQWVGTADYVSPEQLDGKQISARADIYSMTCLLYHALTGEPPFRGPMVAKLKGHALDPLPTVGVGVAHQRAVDRVLTRGGAKSPEERFQSAGDLARGVAAAIAGKRAPIAERSVATGAALAGLITSRDDRGPAGTLRSAGTDATVERTTNRRTRPGPATLLDTRPKQSDDTAPDAEQVQKRRRTGWIITAALVGGALVAGAIAALILGQSSATPASASRTTIIDKTVTEPRAPVTSQTASKSRTASASIATSTPQGSASATTSSHQEPNPSAPASLAPLALTNPPSDAYSVLVPADWSYQSETSSSGNPEDVWTGPNQNDRLQVVTSSCASCVTTNSGGPDPGAVGTPQGTLSTFRPNSWAIGYEAYAQSDPYPDNGIDVVTSQGSTPTGYAQLDLWLPDSQHSTATRILDSFSLFEATSS